MTTIYKQIPITNDPNQQLSFRDNDLIFDLRLISRGDEVYMDVGVDQQIVQTSCRCVPSLPIVEYMTHKINGNFLFLPVGKTNKPLNYQYFNTDWILVYYYEQQS